MTSSQPQNPAAFLKGQKQPLELGNAPYPTPEGSEIVVENAAVAINPADCLVQKMGQDLFSFLTYPCILGCDVAGPVVAVGPDVTRFKPGDRIAGSTMTVMNPTSTKEGALQRFVVVRDRAAFALPPTMPFERGVVLPLGILTSSAALFLPSYLALRLPTTAATPAGRKETLLVWGGSSSVGGNAVQLATAAGYDVVATASPANFDYVRSLGAVAVADYRSDAVVAELVAALKSRKVVGAFLATGGDEGFRRCADVLLEAQKAGVEVRPFIGASNAIPDNLPAEIEAKFSMYEDSEENHALIGRVFREFVPEALAQGKYQTKPDPEVIGHSLEQAQEGLDIVDKGVSAKKIVISFDKWE